MARDAGVERLGQDRLDLGDAVSGHRIGQAFADPGFTPFPDQIGIGQRQINDRALLIHDERDVGGCGDQIGHRLDIDRAKLTLRILEPMCDLWAKQRGVSYLASPST